MTRQVERNFSLWDKDRNGILSESEINAAVADTRFTGEAAAALAALKTALRNAKDSPLPAFDRNYFAQYARSPVARIVTVSPAVPDGEFDDDKKSPVSAVSSASSIVLPRFDQFYQRGMQRLRTTGPDIFLSNDPRLDHIKQRAESDCFFLAVVGAMINRDPSTLRGLITSQRDENSRLTFPGRQPLLIAPLTDAQICLYGSTSSGARWLMLLEEGYGRTINEQRPESSRRDVASDYYLVGGSPAACMRVLTGHLADEIYLRDRASLAMPTSEEIAPKLGALRTGLTDAFRDHRLVTASTNTGTLPPNITPRHAYAVLAYDSAFDTVRLWNPHRNRVRPRGVPGLETGYATQEGIFTVPLADFARIFARVTWERKGE